MTTRAVFSNVFDSTLKSYYHDRECEIIETIIDPASFNVSVPLVNLLPRFKLKFIDNGDIYFAHPAEINHDAWTQDMIDFHEGCSANENGIEQCPHADPHRAQCWQFGYAHAEKHLEKT
ncbi:hypothetical protein D3C73_1156680 [compost metagenome]